jgi:hypothetical protein
MSYVTTNPNDVRDYEEEFWAYKWSVRPRGSATGDFCIPTGWSVQDVDNYRRCGIYGQSDFVGTQHETIYRLPADDIDPDQEDALRGLTKADGSCSVCGDDYMECEHP